jgi:hypothetical protein
MLSVVLGHVGDDLRQPETLGPRLPLCHRNLLQRREGPQRVAAQPRSQLPVPDGEGDISTNWAESYFSRLRRAEFGIHHRISGQYLGAYAREMAWRENNRRVASGEQWNRITAAALTHPISAQWKGYWQRSLRANA